MLDEGKRACIAFTNATILTMDPEQPDAKVVIVEGSRIAHVGNEDMLRQYPGIEKRDLEGRTLIPAFIDSHNHLSSFACFLPEWANLVGLRTKDEIFCRMEEHTGQKAGSPWVVGFGWFDAQCGGVDLTREDLDRVAADLPMALIQTTFHKSVINSAALNLLGIGPDTPNPRCGIIQKGPQGIPTGILIEQAQAPVFHTVMNAGTRRHADLIVARARELLPLGITAIHDPGVTPAAEAAYRLLHREGSLPVSVLMMPHGSSVLDNGIGERLSGDLTGAGDAQLRTGPVKLFADGATAETVAFAMKMRGQTIKSGNYRDDFADELRNATRCGFRTCIHSFGNVTTDAVLDAYEQAAGTVPPGIDLRPRLEHVTLLSDRQIQRLAALKGCVSIQPQFLVRGKGMRQAAIEDAKWFAYGDLSRAGVVVAASSDDPGGFMDARDPIQCCVMGALMTDGDGTTIFPDQVLPFEEWLRMYTANAAWAGGQEHERGILKRGLVADFVVLDGNLDPHHPPRVWETWRSGERVYLSPLAGHKNTG